MDINGWTSNKWKQHQHYLLPMHIGDSNTRLLNQDKLKALLKTKLQSKFKEIWSTKTTEMSKLSFYRQHKINHKFEEYLTLLENRRYKSAIKKLRCSAHRLEIEIGRYNRKRNEVTGKMEPLPREKRTCDICKEKVKDEYHFLFECMSSKQTASRQVFKRNEHTDWWQLQNNESLW